jgi:hypothetical protein
VTFVAIPDKSVDDLVTEPDWDLLKDSINKGVVRPIAEATLGSSASSIDITTIAADWSHLYLVLYARGDTAAASTNVNLRFNGDTGSNYDTQLGRASAATPTANESFANASGAVGTMPANTATANVFGGTIVWIPNYAYASGHKTALALSTHKTGTATGNLNVDLRGTFWRSSAVVTQVTLLPAAGNFVAGTKVTLYGMGGI